METSRTPRVGETRCGYRLIRQLGSGAWRYVATSTRPNKAGRAPPRVVVELFEESATLLRNARALTSLRHPKLVPVREVVVEEGLVAVETDYVEGEWLADLLEASSKSSRMPLGALLRVLVDVLEGLSALHGARGPAREPLHLLHGEVAPSHVLVGADGKARLVHLLRVAPAPTPSPEVTGYLAPEVLLNDQSADARADVFSAGVLLWEIVSGRRLHSATHAGEIVVRLLGGKVQLAEAPKDSLWAQPLAEVARRALSPALAERYATATEMAGAVRRIAGARLASSEDVRAVVESLAGARIRARASGATATRPLAAIAQREAAVAPTAEPRAPSVRPDTPTLVPPRSLPAPPLETASVLRAAPPAPPPSVAAAPEAIELEVEPDSEQPAAPHASPEPRVAPRAPPLPRISVPGSPIPTPIMPVAAVAAFARSLARSAPDEQEPAPSFPPPASAPTPVAPVVTPLAGESAPEATDAPISLTAWSPDPGRARPRRLGRLLMIAAVVVVLPAIAGLAALGRVGGATEASVAKEAREPDHAPAHLAPAHVDGLVEPALADTPAAASPVLQVPSASVAEAPAPLEPPDAGPSRGAEGASGAPHPTEAATSASDPVAPPPPKKSKKTYYPLGI